MNIPKGVWMMGSCNMQGTEVVSNKEYKLGTMCHHFCLRCEGVT